MMALLCGVLIGILAAAPVLAQTGTAPNAAPASTSRSVGGDSSSRLGRDPGDSSTRVGREPGDTSSQIGRIPGDSSSRIGRPASGEDVVTPEDAGTVNSSGNTQGVLTPGRPPADVIPYGGGSGDTAPDAAPPGTTNRPDLVNNRPIGE